MELGFLTFCVLYYIECLGYFKTHPCPSGLLYTAKCTCTRNSPFAAALPFDILSKPICTHALRLVWNQSEVNAAVSNCYCEGTDRFSTLSPEMLCEHLKLQRSITQITLTSYHWTKVVIFRRFQINHLYLPVSILSRFVLPVHNLSLHVQTVRFQLFTPTSYNIPRWLEHPSSNRRVLIVGGSIPPMHMLEHPWARYWAQITAP